MSETWRLNPEGRFTGLAEVYSKSRPSYPPAAIKFILQRCGLRDGSLVADVGSGTGISSRIFAQRGLKVMAIEPNAEMRAKASAHPVPAGTTAPVYQDGRAEATGLADSSVDTVLAAQAFHWFKPEPTLAEFRRILRPGGWVVLIWNERDERDEFTRAYGDIIRTSPDTAAVEGPRGKAGQVLLQSPLFEHAEKIIFTHEQPLDETGLLGRAFSASYAPRTPEGRAQWTEGIKALFAKYERGGRVSVHYDTSVFVAQRNE
jgi:SAM-dependent methyltransferase